MKYLVSVSVPEYLTLEAQHYEHPGKRILATFIEPMQSARHPIKHFRGICILSV